MPRPGPSKVGKHPISGKHVSKRSKTGDPECSRAMSEWKTNGMSSVVAAVLGKCRAKARALKTAGNHRAAGNDLKAQRLEHHVAAGGPVSAKDRMTRARELVAQRQAKQQPKAQGNAAMRAQAQAHRESKGPHWKRALLLNDRAKKMVDNQYFKRLPVTNQQLSNEQGILHDASKPAVQKGLTRLESLRNHQNYLMGVRHGKIAVGNVPKDQKAATPAPVQAKPAAPAKPAPKPVPPIPAVEPAPSPKVAAAARAASSTAAPKPAGPATSKPASHAHVPDQEFAARVHAAGAKAATKRGEWGTFGDAKVWIHHAHAEYEAAHGPIPIGEFKNRLTKLNQSRHLDLARADLTSAMDAGDVAASDAHHLGATFNFVRVPRHMVETAAEAGLDRGATRERQRAAMEKTKGILAAGRGKVRTKAYSRRLERAGATTNEDKGARAYGRSKLASNLRTAHRTTDSDVRFDRVRELSGRRTAEAKAAANAAAAQGVKPEHHERLHSAFSELDAANGGTNFVKLHQLRQKFPDLSRPQFDAMIKEHRLAKSYGLNSPEGRFKLLSKADMKAGITENGARLVYISRHGGGGSTLVSATSAPPKPAAMPAVAPRPRIAPANQDAFAARAQMAEEKRGLDKARTNAKAAMKRGDNARAQEYTAKAQQHSAKLEELSATAIGAKWATGTVVSTTPAPKATTAAKPSTSAVHAEVKSLHDRAHLPETSIEQINALGGKLNALPKGELVKAAEGIGLVGMHGRPKAVIQRNIVDRIRAVKQSAVRTEISDRPRAATSKVTPAAPALKASTGEPPAHVHAPKSVVGPSASSKPAGTDRAKDGAQHVDTSDDAAVKAGIRKIFGGGEIDDRALSIPQIARHAGVSEQGVAEALHRLHAKKAIEFDDLDDVSAAAHQAAGVRLHTNKHTGLPIGYARVFKPHLL